jgi:hypothetical protein
MFQKSEFTRGCFKIDFSIFQNDCITFFFEGMVHLDFYRKKPKNLDFLKTKNIFIKVLSNMHSCHIRRDPTFTAFRLLPKKTDKFRLFGASERSLQIGYINLFIYGFFL